DLAVGPSLARVLRESLRPATERRRLRRERERPALRELSASALQVLQQDAPGHRIHDEVVDDGEKQGTRGPPVEAHDPPERAAAEVEALLGFERGGLDRGPARLRVEPSKVEEVEARRRPRLRAALLPS